MDTHYFIVVLSSSWTSSLLGHTLLYSAMTLFLFKSHSVSEAVPASIFNLNKKNMELTLLGPVDGVHKYVCICAASIVPNSVGFMVAYFT